MKQTEWDAHTDLVRAARQVTDAEPDEPVRGRGPVRKGELGPVDYYIGLASVFCLCCAMVLLFLCLIVALDALPKMAAGFAIAGTLGIVFLVLRGPQ